MRTRFIYLFVALTLSLSGCSSGSSSTTSLTPEVKNLLDNTFAAMIGDNIEQVPGLGVIVFKDGRRVYENFSGRRELTKNLPVERTTRLRVVSVSKMFTVFGIMQLVEAGAIDLDEDASKYLGFTLRNPNFPDEKITVRMLASHTSTLRDGDSYSLAPSYSLEEFFTPDGTAYEDGAHFAHEDKHYFTYCNLNYGVLGTIIERVSGERFDAYIKNHVLKPMSINADTLLGISRRRNFAISELCTAKKMVNGLPKLTAIPSSPQKILFGRPTASVITPSAQTLLFFLRREA